MRVTLTESEFRICRWLAAQRHSGARAAGVTDQQMGPQSAEQTDLDGIGGEFAFCKAANLYPDMTIGARAGGFDAQLHGMSVDVKTTRYENGKLLATLGKSIASADIYVLVVGTIPEYRIAGWVHGVTLIHPRNIRDLGRGPGYALDQHDLLPARLLLRTGT